MAKRKTTAAKRNGKPEGTRGAPRKYDRRKWVPKICEALYDGKPMAVICRELGVPVRTVNQWRDDDEKIAAQFKDAFEIGMHSIAWRSRQTARGKAPEAGGDSTGDVQRDKLIIETDHKLLARWAHALYGERQQLDHTSSDGSMRPAPPMTKEELREAVQGVTAKF